MEPQDNLSANSKTSGLSYLEGDGNSSSQRPSLVGGDVDYPCFSMRKSTANMTNGITPEYNNPNGTNNSTVNHNEPQPLKQSDFTCVAEPDLESSKKTGNNNVQQQEKEVEEDEGLDTTDRPPTNRKLDGNVLKSATATTKGVLSTIHHPPTVNTALYSDYSNHHHSDNPLLAEDCKFQLVEIEGDSSLARPSPPSCLQSVVDGPKVVSSKKKKDDEGTFVKYWRCQCYKQTDSEEITTTKTSFLPRDFFDKDGANEDQHIIDTSHQESSRLRRSRSVRTSRWFSKRVQQILSSTKNSEKPETTATTSILYSDLFYEVKLYPIPGHISIFNMREFSKKYPEWECEDRHGTDVDARELTRLFLDLGFTVDRYDNLGTEEVREIARSSALNKKYEDMAMVGCVVLSHGGDKGLIRTKDGEIELDEIIEPYRNNKKLAGKPKLFIIQACRGVEYMSMVEDFVDGPVSDGVDGGSLQEDKKRMEEQRSVLQLPSESDYLFAYSSVSGFLSWRSSKSGSWFIEGLVQIFRTHAHKMDVVRMFHRVNQVVAERFPNTKDPALNRKRQMPCIVSQLRKDLFLIPPNGPLKP